MINAKRTESFKAPISEVWKLVTDIENYQWRSDISRVEVKDKNHFIEYSKQGYKTFFYITDNEYLRLWACDFENETISGHFVADFKLDGALCMLSIHESINIKKLYALPFANIYAIKAQKKFFSDLKNKLKA